MDRRDARDITVICLLLAASAAVGWALAMG